MPVTTLSYPPLEGGSKTPVGVFGKGPIQGPLNEPLPEICEVQISTLPQGEGRGYPSGPRSPPSGIRPAEPIPPGELMSFKHLADRRLFRAVRAGCGVGAGPVRGRLRQRRYRRQGPAICRASGRPDLQRCLERDRRRQLGEGRQAVRRGRAPASLFDLGSPRDADEPPIATTKATATPMRSPPPTPISSSIPAAGKSPMPSI